MLQTLRQYGCLLKAQVAKIYLVIAYAILLVRRAERDRRDDSAGGWVWFRADMDGPCAKAINIGEWSLATVMCVMVSIGKEGCWVVRDSHADSVGAQAREKMTRRRGPR